MNQRQDFCAVFHLGKDDFAFALLDLSAVTLAAIKRLHQSLEEKASKLDGLGSEPVQQKDQQIILLRQEKDVLKREQNKQIAGLIERLEQLEQLVLGRQLRFVVEQQCATGAAFVHVVARQHHPG